jgi:hypothetical protein
MNKKDPERDFWERAAVTALGAILATETQATVEEAVAMAANAADLLLTEWRARLTKEWD